MTDVPEERIMLPHLRDPTWKLSNVVRLLRELVGKDMSRFTMPVFINEPLSNLHKSTEYYAWNHLLDQAAREEDSLVRLAFVAAYAAARWNLTLGRTQKPFNPLLGETCELVTPKFRAIHE